MQTIINNADLADAQRRLLPIDYRFLEFCYHWQALSCRVAEAAHDKVSRIVRRTAVDRWNRRLATGRDMLWSPTIRAALVAGTPWLDVFCPGCGTCRAIDLRTVDRHPLASVGTLVLGLRCSWCPGSAPMPKLLGLYALPPAKRQGHCSMRQ